MTHEPGTLFLPPSMQFRPISSLGPFDVGMHIPLCGLVMEVSSIEANENLDFKVTIRPVGVTNSAFKQMHGKKGKAQRKAVRNGSRILAGPRSAV